tara:strand:+ start:1899 stop:3368 length:1470 start_codon:yes stop_codon:yes gene_type:complete
MSKEVIVIGSGLAGMSCATYLAKENYKVKVVEKNASYGGRLQSFSQNGFTFDAGPSWYWMPDLFDSYFNDFGKKTTDFYKLTRLDPGYRIYFNENEFLDVSENLDILKEKFEKIESGSGQSLQNYLDDAGEKYRVAVEKFIYKPSLSALEFMELDLLKRLGRLNLFKPISKHIREYFKDPRLIKLLEFPSLLLGAKPSNTPALYSIMNYADLSLGTWYPNGGIRAIATGLYQNALDHNVEFLFNHPVSKIETKENIVDHILVHDKKIKCDIVVGGADYHHVENHLMDKKNRNYDDNYWDKRTMSPSSLLFYLGINKELDIPHHALFFDTDFDKHAEEIYDKPQWPKNPLFYVSCTSKTDNDVAPKGSEAVFILVPVAPGLNDNEKSRETIFQQIVKRLENALGTNIKDSIVFKRSYAHKEFISEFNSYKGNAYGLANTLFQTAIFKPRIKNKKLTNMYYCGQLTVPGPGMPPSLVSGKIVAKQIIKDYA